jgi:hypothetical protein
MVEVNNRGPVLTPEAELTIPEAGQMINRSPAQVTRLITLGSLTARRDSRGWWKVNLDSARRYAEQQRKLRSGK